MSKLTKVISQETGEIGTLVPDTGEYVIMHRNSLFANNKNLTDQKKGANHPFFFVCLDSFSQLSHIKDKYLGYFLMLCSYIDYSNRITYGQNKIPASKRQLLDILNINSNTLNDFLTAAFAEELIYMDTTYDAYIVNPKIIYRGEIRTLLKSTLTQLDRFIGTLALRILVFFSSYIRLLIDIQMSFAVIHMNQILFSSKW